MIPRTNLTSAFTAATRFAIVYLPSAQLTIPYALDELADPLLLADAGARLTEAITADDLPAVLSIQGAEDRQLWLSGWLSHLCGEAERAAADHYAATHPVGAVLDIGHTSSLYRIDVAEVRLRSGDEIIELDPDQYREQLAPSLRASLNDRD